MSKAELAVQHWLRHRTVLENLLPMISDEHLSYQPWEKAFSLGDLVVHIAGSSVMFARAIKNGAFQPPSSRPTYTTVEDLRRIMQESTEETTALLRSLSDDVLEQTMPFNRFVANGQHWLDTLIDHEIHHKGQLMLYARQVGVENLPFFIVQPPKKEES